MAPRRRSESRAVKLATSAAIFVLSANVAYQVSQSLGRPAPAPPVARAGPDHRLGAHLKHLHLRPRHRRLPLHQLLLLRPLPLRELQRRLTRVGIVGQLLGERAARATREEVLEEVLLTLLLLVRNERRLRPHLVSLALV